MKLILLFFITHFSSSVLANEAFSLSESFGYCQLKIAENLQLIDDESAKRPVNFEQAHGIFNTWVTDNINERQASSITHFTLVNAQADNSADNHWVYWVRYVTYAGNKSEKYRVYHIVIDLSGNINEATCETYARG